MTEPTRVVVCAAIRYTFKFESNIPPTLVCGPRHFDQTMHRTLERFPPETLAAAENAVQGFVDQFGTFMTREEALEVARAAGQLNTRRPKSHPLTKLFSEDLY